MEKNIIYSLMNKYGPLTEKELETASVEKIILHNLRFAYTHAQKMSKKYPGLTNDEIIEAAFLGITLAANRWDPKKSKISSYISQYVRVTLKGMANENTHSIQRNSMYIWKSFVINNFVNEFKNTHNREPTVDEIAEQCVTNSGKRFPKSTIYNVWKLGIKSITSFNHVNTDDESTNLHDIIADEEQKNPFHQTSSNDLSKIMIRLIADLSDNEREIITRKWYNNHKYNQISKELGIHLKVKKIEVIALNKIKQELKAIEKF